MTSALEILRDDHRFLASNAMKSKREEWIILQWLKRHNPSAVWQRPERDPPDFIVDGQGVEVVEVLDEGRKRGDECRDAICLANSLSLGDRQLAGSDLQSVMKYSAAWIAKAVTKKSAKYEAVLASSWRLLVYANISWAERIDWHEVRRRISEYPPVFSSVVCLLNSGQVETLK